MVSEGILMLVLIVVLVEVLHRERTDTGRLGIEDVEAALDELLFSGSTLNRKLLGARNEESEGCLGRS
jgi:hypothetical protein